MPSSRKSPVIVITGTPGTGKSTHAELLAQESPIPLTHINVSEFVKEKTLYEEYDEEWQSYTVDEDKVSPPSFYAISTRSKKSRKLLDELEPLASAGGIILDWHSCEPWPERWVDLVVVLRCDHSKLWERLEKRHVRLSVTSIHVNVTDRPNQKLPHEKDPGEQSGGDHGDRFG